jgi:hypothetical protein
MLVKKIEDFKDHCRISRSATMKFTGLGSLRIMPVVINADSLPAYHKGESGIGVKALRTRPRCG